MGKFLQLIRKNTHKQYITVVQPSFHGARNILHNSKCLAVEDSPKYSKPRTRQHFTSLRSTRSVTSLYPLSLEFHKKVTHTPDPRAYAHASPTVCKTIVAQTSSSRSPRLSGITTAIYTCHHSTRLSEWLACQAV